MASARHHARGLGAVGLILLLSACGGLPRYSELIGGGKPVNFSARATPPDPPPVPDRKPTVPAGFTLAVASQPAAEIGAQPARLRVEPSSYRVTPGDTVHQIAGRFGVPLRNLIDANGLQPPYSLLVGQTLAIPRPRLHEVAPGDTVYAISRRYGADMAELVRLNKIAAPYNIVLGQKLVIPGTGIDGGVQMASLQVADTTEGAAAEALDGAEQAGPLKATPVQTTAQGKAGGTQLAVAMPLPKPAPTAAPSANANAPVPQPPPLHGGKFLWPVSGPILSAYGPKSDGLHNDGVNIAAPRGTPIVAAENGVVAYAGNELRGFGNLLLLKHSGGWVTAYAHTDEILVQRGQTVERGQVVARVGSSGNVSVPQLHFEVRKGVRTLDPARLLEARIAAAN